MPPGFRALTSDAVCLGQALFQTAAQRRNREAQAEIESGNAEVDRQWLEDRVIDQLPGAGELNKADH